MIHLILNMLHFCKLRLHLKLRLVIWCDMALFLLPCTVLSSQRQEHHYWLMLLDTSGTPYQLNRFAPQYEGSVARSKLKLHQHQEDDTQWLPNTCIFPPWNRIPFSIAWQSFCKSSKHLMTLHLYCHWWKFTPMTALNSKYYVIISIFSQYPILTLLDFVSTCMSNQHVSWTWRNKMALND